MANEILQCSLEDFLGHYAPWQVPVDIVESVHEYYIHTTSLIKQTAPRGFVFAAFSKQPTKIESDEAKVFKPLKEIVNFLLDEEVRKKLHQPRNKATLHYEDCPSKNTTSEIKGTDMRFDAYLTGSGEEDHLDPTVKGVDLADVAVVAEFKKRLKDNIQNRRQLISDVSQILNNDPRRTWMYAFTIENNMMSIWYFSRSHTVVSVPFDFTTDIKSFIHVFLSLIYATREEIGYDPTVHRVLLGDKIRYVYEMVPEGTTRKRYFKTIDTLFVSRVLCITGRKTRVWKAVEVEGFKKGEYEREVNGGREVALKDCWLDEGSKTEKAILCDIFERLENTKHDATLLDWAVPEIQPTLRELFDTGDYKQYFMGIEADMQLSTTKPRLASATPVPDFFTPLPSFSKNAKSERSTQTTHSQMDMVSPRPRTGQNRPKSPIPRKYRIKQHYRLIYEEVGRPLSAATNLQSTFYALYDILIALTLLYLAGYVHRDVSTGNIIMIEKPNAIRGKLSDLEYAKVFQDGEPSLDLKTGTIFFMAYEIHAGEVLYVPPLEHDFLSYQWSPGVSPISPETPTRPKFRFTHDLESLIWVKLYFLAKYLPRGKSQAFFDAIYVVAHSPPSERSSLLKKDAEEFISYLEDRLDKQVTFFARPLARFQSALKWSYFHKNDVENIFDRTTYHKLYNAAFLAFSEIKAVFEYCDVPNFEFVCTTGVEQQSLQQQRQRKGPRTEQALDDDDYTSRKRNTQAEDQPARKQPRRGKRMES